MNRLSEGYVMGKQFRPRISFLDLIPPEERGGPDLSTEKDHATDLELAFGSLAPSSPAQYKSALKRLDAWLGRWELDDKRLGLYLRDRDQFGWLAPSSIRGIVEAARFRCKALE